LSQRPDIPGLPTVHAAWQAVARAGGEFYLLADGAPVDEAEFRQFELDQKVQIPAPRRALYEIDRLGVEVTDLGIGVGGWPPRMLSEWEMPVDREREPRQLRWIGGDLGENVWAVWLPPVGSSLPSPVIVVRDYNDEDLVVAASGLVEFLRLETAASLLLASPPGAGEALDVLEVPGELRGGGLDMPELLAELTRWADPRLAELGSYTERPGVGLDRIENAVAELS